MTCHIDMTPFTQKKKETKSIVIAMVIAALFMLLELFGGIVAQSLALISDALHMFTDVGAFLMSLVALSLAKRPITHKMTYGSARAEVLGALASSLTLFALSFVLIYEAIHRFIHPHEVSGGIVFVIASIGLVANLAMMKTLHSHSHHCLNVKAAYLHVLGDLLGSIGVIASGALIYFTGINLFDPLITIIFALVILYSAGKMVLQTVTILMEGAPSSINFEEVKKDLLALPGVSKVKDLHIWSLSPKQIALSSHLIASHNKEVLAEAEKLLKTKYSIYHTTIQVE